MEVEVETRLDFQTEQPTKCVIFAVTYGGHLIIIRNIFINKNSVPTEYINEFSSNDIEVVGFQILKSHVDDVLLTEPYKMCNNLFLENALLIPESK